MRGQAYTLESIVAALLIISSLIFALQVTAVTPLSASTSSQHIENQQRASAAGGLTAASEIGVLKESISTIDSEGRYYGNASDGAFVNDYPDDEFGAILDRTFGGRGLAVDIAVRYQDTNTSWSTVQMVDRGAPSDNAVTATRSVTLYNDEPIYNATGDQHGTWGCEDHEDDDQDGKDPFGICDNDVHTESDVYTVVVVEVTVWRM